MGRTSNTEHGTRNIQQYCRPGERSTRTATLQRRAGSLRWTRGSAWSALGVQCLEPAVPAGRVYGDTAVWLGRVRGAGRTSGKQGNRRGGATRFTTMFLNIRNHYCPNVLKRGRFECTSRCTSTRLAGLSRTRTRTRTRRSLLSDFKSRIYEYDHNLLFMCNLST